MVESSDAESVEFHSRFNRVLAVVVWVLIAFVVVSTIVGDAANTLQALLPGLCIAVVAWIVLWRPHLVVAEDGVTLVNVLRRQTVPWAALINVDTKFALTLFTPGAKYVAWAAPAPGRTGAAVAKRQSRSGNVAPRGAVGGQARPSDLLSTESGAAADMVRERWYDLRDSGRLEVGRADEARVVTSVLWLPAAIAVVLAVAAGVVLSSH
ncbi:PH domain-containing protein [Frondihabitans cladoniiphilus]|uniref:Low molecular weight protein antigen 6 PH domain-containing protein n=1 Tax=Frondihabitans cladoniiphilus TaxID=715785 RepID=A0ABP8VRP1_9MICO